MDFIDTNPTPALERLPAERVGAACENCGQGPQQGADGLCHGCEKDMRWVGYGGRRPLDDWRAMRRSSA